MRIIAFPVTGYYARMFYKEVKGQNIEVVEGNWSGRWMRSYLRKDDIAHIHWPSFFYETQGSTAEIIMGFIKFVMLFLYLRCRCRGVVWTAHNLFPHERCRIKIVDVWVRLLVIRMASMILVHGREAQKVLIERFPGSKKKCTVIPFGNWQNAYPPPVSKVEARERLGLSKGLFVYLVLGRCRPYKNIETVVAQFRRMATKDDRLIIAGAFSDESYLSKVREEAASDSRIIINPDFVEPAQVTEYVCACDVICAPYKDILTSGTAMLALSFGRPVISIDRGFLRDLINDRMGILVEPGQGEEFGRAMGAAKRIKWGATAIRSYAKTFTYQTAAIIFKEKLIQLVSEPRRADGTVQAAIERELN